MTNGGESPVLGCDVGPLSIVYDATSHNNNAALVGFLGGLQAVQWRQKNVSFYKKHGKSQNSLIQTMYKQDAHRKSCYISTT